jgi:RHS repeat-associated protein
VTDTAGRQVHFAHDANGRVTSIVVPSKSGERLVFARYAYDAGGRLVESFDADGHRFGYAYDDLRRLVCVDLPTGASVHYRYDSSDRCIETWVAEPGGAEPAIDPGCSTFLADGVTRVKGVLHAKVEYGEDGYSELIDSVGVRRQFGTPGGTVTKGVGRRGGVTTRELDAYGRILAQQDANGAAWRYTYDTLGNVLSEEDPSGRTIRFTRDREGRILEMRDPAGGVTRHERDPDGNVVATESPDGARVSYLLDDRGMPVEVRLPDGARRLTRYDAMGNVSTETLPNGAVIESTHDYWGRRTSRVEADGRRVDYRHSPSGRLLSMADGTGRVKSYEYDGLGNVVAVRFPNGTTLRYLRSGLGWLHAEVGPLGTLRAYYNREGWLTRLVNQSGEVASFEYGLSGTIVRERTFDGRERQYKRDARDRIVGVKDSLGLTAIERNAVGQVVKMVSPDGEERSFEYDARGELVSASCAGVELAWQRDAVGRIVHESLAVDGESYEVSTGRDPLGRRTASRTSLGLEVELRRDALGKVAEMWSAGERVLRFERDPLGAAIRRELPLGGVVVDELDAASRLRRRSVLPVGGAAAREAGEPERVGGPERPVIEKTFAYDDVSEIVSVTTTDDGTVEYFYDLDRHLLERRSREGSEKFSYGPTGDVHPVGDELRARRYAPGGRLEAVGAVELRYDSRGRLVEKRVPSSNGQLDVTRFHYDGWNFLRAVELHDGSRVELRYDPFARRVEKKVTRKLPDGSSRLLRHTRYVWDLLAMVHEVELVEAAPSVQTYLFEDNRESIPTAQRVGASGPVKDWQFLVGGVLDTPEEIIDGEGHRLARLERDAYGRVRVADGARASTPFRFPGQQEDEETSLHYNRYRYYDPDTGRYITPDPIGLAGGLSPYEYGPNPIGWIDPMGWAHHMDVGEDSSEVLREVLRSSYVSGMGSDPEAESFCPRDLRNRTSCHTERKALADLEANLTSEQLEGTTLNLRGDYPPCPNCHRAMHDFARRNNMTINYSYPRTGPANTIAYGGEVPMGNTAAARRLLRAYEMEERSGRSAEQSSLNASERYEFDSWSNATTGYRAGRSNPNRRR